MSAQFTQIGGSFFRQNNSGELFAVSDPDTLKGLKAGQLPYKSIENSRGLTFALDKNKEINEAEPQKAKVEQPSNFEDTIKRELVNTLKNYQGVSNVSELEERRQSLLRQQMLSAPYSEEGEKDLTSAQKLSLMRTRGEEFEPQIQSLERQIIEKKNMPVEKLQTLTSMVALAKDLGFMEGDRLMDLKIEHPEISDADTMEEALGYLGSEIKKDKELERKIKRAQLKAEQDAANATDVEEGKTLGATSVKNLSDARFLPGVLDKMEKIVDEQPNLFGKLKNIQLIGTEMKLNPVVAFDPKVEKAEAELRRAAQLVGKFMEGGVLRKEDEIKYAKMLPNLADLNSDVAQNKLDGVRQMLAMKYNNYLTDFRGSGYDVSAFKPIDFGEKTETKTVNGNKYMKVEGGWQLINE